MKKIIQNHMLKLIYKPGFGSWTYHLVIPDTATLQGKWGQLKVCGTIDHYPIYSMNLAPRKKEDKIISINKKIRDAIQKSGGDFVNVTLYLLDWNDDESSISTLINDLLKHNKK